MQFKAPAVSPRLGTLNAPSRSSPPASPVRRPRHTFAGLLRSRLPRAASLACALLAGAAPVLAKEIEPPTVIWDATVDLKKHEPMRRYFRLRLTLPETAVKSARLRFGGSNLGEINVNGVRVGDWNGWGDMPRYEIASLLRPGDNIVSVAVDRGTSRLHPLMNVGRKGNHYAFLGRLRIDLADGTHLDFDTDSGWQVSSRLPADWPEARLADGWAKPAVYTTKDLWDYVVFNGNPELTSRLFKLDAQPTLWDREQAPRPFGPVEPAGRRHVAGVGSGRQYLTDASGRSVYWLGLGTQVSIGRSASVSPTYEYQHREAEDWYRYLGSHGLNGSLLFVGEPWTAATAGYLAPFLERWDRLGYSVMAIPMMNRTIFVDGTGPALGKRHLQTSYDSDYFFPDSKVRRIFYDRYDAVLETVAKHPSVFSLSLHDEAFYWPKAGSTVQEAAWRRFVEKLHGDLASAARSWGRPDIKSWDDVTLAKAMSAKEGSRLNLDLGHFRDEVVVNHLDAAAKYVKAKAPRILITKNFNNWTNWIAKTAAERIPELDIISLNNFTHRLYEFAGQIRFTRAADRPYLAPSIRADNIAATWTAFMMGSAGSAPFYDPRWFLYATHREISQMLHVRELVDEIDLSDFRRAPPAVAVLYAPEVEMNTNASDFSNPMLEQPSAKRYVRAMRALDRAGVDHDHIRTEAEASRYAAVVRLDKPLDVDATAAALAVHSSVRIPGHEDKTFSFRLLREDRRLGFYMIGALSVLDDSRTDKMPAGAHAPLSETSTTVATLTGLGSNLPARATILHPLTGERLEKSLQTNAAGELSLELPRAALDGFVIVRVRAE